MNVTNINIHISKDKNDPVRATVQLDLDESITIKDIRVVRKQNGDLMVGMPSRKKTRSCESERCPARPALIDSYCPMCGTSLTNDLSKTTFTYQDIVFPKNKEARKKIEEMILNEYRKKLNV